MPAWFLLVKVLQAMRRANGRVAMIAIAGL